MDLDLVLVFPGTWIISIDQLLVQSYSPTPVCTMALTPIFPAMVNTAIIVNHRIRHWEINGREAGKFTYREIDPVSIAPAQELKDGCKGLPYSYLNMIIANFMSMTMSGSTISFALQ